MPPDTRVLIAPLDGVGRDYPLSIEKLCPVLSFYVVKDWREGCERCKQILRYGGMGHTMSIHSQNEQVILEFGLKKPAFRIVVNSPTTHGSIGLTTGLDPAMTLGCGGYGGNITSDNISPRHLLNIKRLAYEIAPAANRFEQRGGRRESVVARPATPASRRRRRRARLRRPGISAEALTRRIDQFLGIARVVTAALRVGPGSEPDRTGADRSGTGVDRSGDRRRAARLRLRGRCAVGAEGGRKLVVSERAIVTPAARDSAEQHRVFTIAPVIADQMLSRLDLLLTGRYGFVRLTRAMVRGPQPCPRDEHGAPEWGRLTMRTQRRLRTRSRSARDGSNSVARCAHVLRAASSWFPSAPGRKPARRGPR